MKILVLTDDLPPAVLGGSGRIAWETSLGLVQRGHDVTILTAAQSGVFSEKKDGVHIRTITQLDQRWAHYRSVFSRKRQMEVLRVVDEVQPDLIHAHGLAWQLGYRWIKPATQRGIAIVHTFHGVMNVAYGKRFGDEKFPLLRDLKLARWTYNPLRNMNVRWALRRTTLLSVSNALKHYLKKYGYHGVQTLHNGINTDFWTTGPDRETARKELGIAENQPCFLLAGRIGHDKGMTIVKESLPPNALLLLAGEGNEASWKDLGDRVRFFPKQTPEQMRTLYAVADASLVPSLYLDPFPTVCLESMMCATPVIASIHGGAKEAVKDGESGWIVEPRKMESFAEHLRWCATHREETALVGKKARVHAKAQFSLEKHLDALEKIYAASSRS